MSYTPGLLSAPSPSTVRGSATKLGVTPSGDKLVYTNGRGVFLRGLDGTTAYFGHQKDATVAKVSPTGYYCASADVSGTVRIWDLAGQDQVLKCEVKAVNGRINDLAWDGESKRIIAVGEGRERFGHAFMFDSGSSVGEISGHSKVINTVAIRRDRPFRAVTGSDDGTLVFLHGAPYKYTRTIKTHTSFVHSVAYSPSGDHFASAGADRKIFMYDGKTGDPLGEELADGHTGGVFAVSWSTDSKRFVSSSADCTVKIWDAETRKAVRTWSLASTPTPEHHQVGNVWAQEHEIVSLSSSGDLNAFDIRTDSAAPALILSGHQKGITALTRSASTASPTLYSGSYDGRINSFVEPKKREDACRPIKGAGHSNGVVALAATGDRIVSVGMDDSLRYVETGSASFSSSFASTSKLPTAVAADANGTAFVATVADVQVHSQGQKASSTPADYTPRAIAHSAKRNELAVGGEDGRVRLYTLGANHALTLAYTTDAVRGGAITCLAYCPSSDLLAVGDAGGKIVVLHAATRTPKITQWVFHTARVLSLAWSEDGKYAASGALDTNVYVWSVDKPMRNIAIKNAHPGGATGVVWESGTKLATAGSDATIRRWDIKHHV